MSYEFYRVEPEKIVFKTDEMSYDNAAFGLYLSRKYKRPVILNVNGTKIGITPTDGLLWNKLPHIVNLYHFAIRTKGD